MLIFFPQLLGLNLRLPITAGAKNLTKYNRESICNIVLNNPSKMFSFVDNVACSGSQVDKQALLLTRKVIAGE